MGLWTSQGDFFLQEDGNGWREGREEGGSLDFWEPWALTGNCTVKTMLHLRESEYVSSCSFSPTESTSVELITDKLFGIKMLCLCFP